MFRWVGPKRVAGVVAESLGYPFIQSGQDQGLLKRFKADNLRRADPIEFDPRPSYVYRWFTAHSQHLSAMGQDGYEHLGRERVATATRVSPGWARNWSSHFLGDSETP